MHAVPQTCGHRGGCLWHLECQALLKLPWEAREERSSGTPLPGPALVPPAAEAAPLCLLPAVLPHCTCQDKSFEVSALLTFMLK